MKTILAPIILALGLASTHAHDSAYVSDYGAVSYVTPVIYSSPVVYQAPVNYYAPVYYVASAASAAIYSVSERACANPSTVVHITGGRGTYVTSNCDYGDSGVIVIGTRYARRDAHYRTGWHPSDNRHHRHSWVR